MVENTLPYVSTNNMFSKYTKCAYENKEDFLKFSRHIGI